MVKYDVIAALLHGVVGPELDEVGVAVKNADDLDVMAKEADAAVEITALAAGAGPPAKRIATR